MNNNLDDILKNYTVKELFDTVRKSMVWKGQSLEKKVDKYLTVKMWLEEENIVPGTLPVKSSAMHDNYVKWCKTRGVSSKSILSNIELGKFLRKNFQYSLRHNSKHYFVSKDLIEDEEEKKKRKEAFSKKRNSKSQKT